MEMHGAILWGADLLSAYQAMERLEYTAQLECVNRQIGADRVLPPSEIEKLIGMRAQYGVC